MRTPNDQWDIVSSVGWTALMVAAGRAVETHRADGLVDDPWAERFVAQADTPRPVPTHPGELWPDATRVGTEPTPLDQFWSAMSTYQGVRSRFIDEALLGARVPQVVLLAAGLDTRAHRLAWPAGTTIFEVDQERVLDFKDHVLAEEGARPRATRRPVPVDLRDDWVGALRSAGFDPEVPSAFLAEGLLPFLPAGAEAELLRLVGTLTAPGSTVVVEHFAPALDELFRDPGFAGFGRPFGVEMTELADLDDQRPHPADALRADGWDVRVESSLTVAEGYGRPIPALSSGAAFENDLLVATRR